MPDPTKMEQVASGLSNPVDLVTGPDGNLFYVDHDGGRVMRIRYVLAPTARITADPDEAQAPVTVQLVGHDVDRPRSRRHARRVPLGPGQ